ncbi:hypothetical protein LCGC14_0357190 [marine sediment metagenome]|uniref:Uncharacterized protein n=1 Tax=marine sediment metagenome TaxID=412755 RepID=A0A0F9T947_9ZZZZ
MKALLRYYVIRGPDCVAIVDRSKFTEGSELLVNTPGVVHWRYGLDAEEELQESCRRKNSRPLPSDIVAEPQTKTTTYEPRELHVKCGWLEIDGKLLRISGVEPKSMTKAVLTLDWTTGPNAGITLELTQIVDPRITTHPNGVEAPSEPTE